MAFFCWAFKHFTLLSIKCFKLAVRWNGYMKQFIETYTSRFEMQTSSMRTARSFLFAYCTHFSTTFDANLCWDKGKTFPVTADTIRDLFSCKKGVFRWKSIYINHAVPSKNEDCDVSFVKSPTESVSQLLYNLVVGWWNWKSIAEK